MLDSIAFTQFAFAQPSTQAEVYSISKMPQYPVSFHSQHYVCYLGENGVSENKKEGDKTTPIGDFGLKKVFFRSDRISLQELKTQLPTQALQPNDGWCDDPAHPQYNQFVKLPFSASHEKLWIDLDYYDLILVTDYNMNPTLPGKGSAIFIHIKDKATRGCLGFRKEDLLAIIHQATPTTRVRITPTGKIQFYQPK